MTKRDLAAGSRRVDGRMASSEKLCMSDVPGHAQWDPECWVWPFAGQTHTRPVLTLFCCVIPKFPEASHVDNVSRHRTRINLGSGTGLLHDNAPPGDCYGATMLAYPL